MANPPAKPLPDPPADERPSKSAAVVEALLFTSDSPLPAARIAELAELPGERAVKDAVAALNARYERDGAAFCIQALAGGYQMLTRPEFHDCIARLLRDRSDSRLTQAAMETLAIVAYRQPILRADVEAIRGVACGEVLRGLLERQLIKIVGRAQVIGRPMLYGTTRRFLETFGLESLDDLPKVEELRTAAARSPAASPAGPEPVEGPATAAPAPADAAPSQPPTVPSEPQEK